MRREKAKELKRFERRPTLKQKRLRREGVKKQRTKKERNTNIVSRGKCEKDQRN